MTTNPVLSFALWVTDLIFATIPRKTPSAEAFSNCKIISHRGEHDNQTILENTMEAFQTASVAGAWGLEMDIRWTKDLVPVVAHDADTLRVFGKNLKIADTIFSELRGCLPEIPTLEEFVKTFGGKNHLMIEMKDEVFPDLDQQKSILIDILGALVPQQDYHLLALDTDLFEKFDIVPNAACLPVATLNYKALSAVALEKGYAGLSGHFLVLSNAMKRKHENVGQLFGTGFPTSKNCLFRELNRGVEYIFTNDAVELLSLIDAQRQILKRD